MTPSHLTWHPPTHVLHQLGLPTPAHFPKHLPHSCDVFTDDAQEAPTSAFDHLSPDWKRLVRPKGEKQTSSVVFNTDSQGSHHTRLQTTPFDTPCANLIECVPVQNVHDTHSEHAK